MTDSTMTTSPTARPTQTADRDACPACRMPVAEDQSYCLSCGARQPRAKKPFVSRDRALETPATPSGDHVPRDWTALIALGGLAALALVLVIGVLIGRSGQSNSAKLAGAPQVITVGSGGPSTTASSTSSGSGSINEDWPAGKSAWTVELQTIAKAGATPGSVDAAKSSATGKGATGVGVLDAANYTSLGSDYIIYSGVYPSQAKAATALAKLKKSFPDAKVIHVVPANAGAAANTGTPPSAAQQAAGAKTIQQLNNCTGAACSKAARKITQPIATPGTAPPVDNKAPGGGGSAQTFQ
jgi:hypothetical protein